LYETGGNFSLGSEIGGAAQNGAISDTLLAVADGVQDIGRHERGAPELPDADRFFLLQRFDPTRIARAGRNKMRDVGPWSRAVEVRDFLLAEMPKLERLGLLENLHWGLDDLYLEEAFRRMEQQESEATAARIFGIPREAHRPREASP
jgi:hypothetical protein